MTRPVADGRTDAIELTREVQCSFAEGVAPSER